MDKTTAESLVVREAYLIDERQFDEWLTLFSDDGIYWVPAGHYDVDPDYEVSVIYDSELQRRLRVSRLQSQNNWTQDPPARVRHFVSNIWVDETADDGPIVHSNQLIAMARMGSTSILPAFCTHRFVQVDDIWRIREKKVCLLGVDHYLEELISLV